MLFPLLLILTLQGSSSLDSQTYAPESKELLSLAPIMDPQAREKKVMALLSKFHGTSLDWEKKVRQLPHPLLPFSHVKAGSIRAQKTVLFMGKKKGVKQRELLIYVPKTFQKGRVYPLLLAMHGSGGNAGQQIQQWRGYADRNQLLLVASTGKDTAQGYGFSESERQAELSTLRFALLHLPIDPNRIFLGGTSRGGHLSWDLGLRYPDRWAGIAPMIGGPRLTTRLGQNNLRLLDNLLQTPILDLQGLKDDPGLIWNLRYAFAYFKRLKAPHKQFLTFPLLGHSYDMSQAPWKSFFSSGKRNPFPNHLQFRCVQLAHARSFWVKATKLDPKKVQNAVGIAIPPQKWNRMPLEEKRKLFAKTALKRTAILEANWKKVKGNPQFKIKTKGIKNFELLLPKPLLPPDPNHRILVRWNHSRKRLHGDLNAKRFLLDWLDRLDLETAPLLILKWR